VFHRGGTTAREETMPSSDGSMFDLIGILAVLAFVVANGFLVAAEFSLVAVRRSRVAELVSARRTNATALERAVDNLDAYLAATQLGITISSLAVGWIGERAPSESIASRRRCAPKRLNAAWLVVSLRRALRTSAAHMQQRLEKARQKPSGPQRSQRPGRE
jgi:CBS domain containing-hemolysin-like protein